MGGYLPLCREVNIHLPPTHGYDTKQSDSEISAMLEIWGMRNAPSLPSLPGPLGPGVVASDRVVSMGQIEVNCILDQIELLEIELP